MGKSQLVLGVLLIVNVAGQQWIPITTVIDEQFLCIHHPRTLRKRLIIAKLRHTKVRPTLIPRAD